MAFLVFNVFDLINWFLVLVRLPSGQMIKKGANPLFEFLNTEYIDNKKMARYECVSIKL